MKHSCSEITRLAKMVALYVYPTTLTTGHSYRAMLSSVKKDAKGRLVITVTIGNYHIMQYGQLSNTDEYLVEIFDDTLSDGSMCSERPPRYSIFGLHLDQIE